jgi:hypothetical protein
LKHGRVSVFSAFGGKAKPPDMRMVVDSRPALLPWFFYETIFPPFLLKTVFSPHFSFAFFDHSTWLPVLHMVTNACTAKGALRQNKWG